MRYYYDGTTNDDADDEGDDGAFIREQRAERERPLADEDAEFAADSGEDDDALEADFPRGDGTADTSAVGYCPYCGELNELAVDPGGGSPQSYVEDCHVCCRPWRVTVTFDGEGTATVDLAAADE